MRRRVYGLTLAGLVAAGSCASAEAGELTTKKLIITYNLTEGADLGASYWAWQQGAGESNPFMRAPTNTLLARKATGALVLAGASKGVEKTLGKRWERRFRWAVIASRGYLVARAIQDGRKIAEIRRNSPR